MKCVRGVDEMFSFVYVLTLALYESGCREQNEMAQKMQTYDAKGHA